MVWDSMVEERDFTNLSSPQKNIQPQKERVWQKMTFFAESCFKRSPIDLVLKEVLRLFGQRGHALFIVLSPYGYPK